MFLTGSGGPHLYLLGGSSSDWNTGEATDTRRVWRLMWASGSQTYSLHQKESDNNGATKSS